jgi:hypothetical protein
MAVEQDVLDESFRKGIIDEILGQENKARKADAFRKVDIYKMNLKPYLASALEREYSETTMKEMRKISSINPSQRIVNEMASIYKSPPARTFGEVSEGQYEVLMDIYRYGQFDMKLKKANRYFKFLQQCAIQVLPIDGVITAKVFSPHQYDVIPREDNPEKALAYIINVMDKNEIFRTSGSDQVNQKIADKDDFLKLAKMRFIWWTDSYHFMTDGHGKYLPQEGDPQEVSQAENPIGKLPFIDVCNDKDHEFWTTSGSTVIDFATEFSVILSDTATVNRNQGFSQMIYTGPEKPQSMEIGRQRALFIPQNPDPDAKDPKFEFATPSPDLSASLDLVDQYLKLWLSSQNVDPKTVSGSGDVKSYSSGLERLLATMDKFEASKDDIDLFKIVEDQLFDLIVKWNNAYQGSDLLISDLQRGLINENATISVNFVTPQFVQTKAEQEDSLIKLKKESLKDDVEILMELEGLDEQMAIEKLIEKEIRKARLKKLISERMVSEGLQPLTEPEPPMAEIDEVEDQDNQGEDALQDEDAAS